MVYRLVFSCIFIFTLQVDCLACTWRLLTGLLGAGVAEACSAAVLQPAVSTCSRVQSPAADWRLLQIRSGAAGDNDSGHCSLQSTRRPEISLQQVEDDISGITPDQVTSNPTMHALNPDASVVHRLPKIKFILGMLMYFLPTELIVLYNNVLFLENEDIMLSIYK